MSSESLAARVSTARTLIEECTRDAEDVPPGVEADLWEALEFLTKLDEALGQEVDVSTPRAEADECTDSTDVAIPREDATLSQDETGSPADGTGSPADGRASPADGTGSPADVAESAHGGEALEPEAEPAEPGDRDPPGDDAALPRVHSYSDIVVFRPVEGGASQYIVATPDTVLELDEWR